MRAVKKLYIDEEGVERGYYVYLHRDGQTNEVFYVGMGHGRRAWDKKRQHDAWLQKIASLGDDWTVEILKDDLSELEAFQLEHDKVIEYGGPSRSGGKLTNVVHGGEQPGAVTISLEILDFGWHAAYYAARKFRAIPRLEQETLVQGFLSQIDSTEIALDNLDNEGSDNQDDVLADSASTITNILRNAMEAGEDFLKRRLSWKEFSIVIEQTNDELMSEIGNLTTHHARVRPLLEFAAGEVRRLFEAIDSGNRESAEAYAHQIAKENAELIGR
jgi:hypothetical protein